MPELTSPALVAAAGVLTAVAFAWFQRARASRRYGRLRVHDGRASGAADRLREGAVGGSRGTQRGGRTGAEIGRAVGEAIGLVLDVFLSIILYAAEEAFETRIRRPPFGLCRLVYGYLGAAIGALLGAVLGGTGGFLQGTARGRAAPLPAYRRPPRPLRQPPPQYGRSWR